MPEWHYPDSLSRPPTDIKTAKKVCMYPKTRFTPKSGFHCRTIVRREQSLVGTFVVPALECCLGATSHRWQQCSIIGRMVAFLLLQLNPKSTKSIDLHKAVLCSICSEVGFKIFYRMKMRRENLSDLKIDHTKFASVCLMISPFFTLFSYHLL